MATMDHKGGIETVVFMFCRISMAPGKGNEAGYLGKVPEMKNGRRRKKASKQDEIQYPDCFSRLQSFLSLLFLTCFLSNPPGEIMIHRTHTPYSILGDPISGVYLHADNSMNTKLFQFVLFKQEKFPCIIDGTRTSITFFLLLLVPISHTVPAD
jgi:hypothetical protein